MFLLFICSRVVQQLMYTLPKDEDIPVKKILLANGLSAWGVPHGRTEFLRNKCPVDRCYLTSDYGEAATADAILYKDHHLPFNVKRPLKQVNYYSHKFCLLLFWPFSKWHKEPTLLNNLHSLISTKSRNPETLFLNDF